LFLFLSSSLILFTQFFRGSAEADCYLARLLQREGSKNVTEEEINSNVAGLLIAGVDTTANTLQWFIWNIARTPKVQGKKRKNREGEEREYMLWYPFVPFRSYIFQEQLYKEVSTVLQGRSLTKEDISKLPLMRAALKENFRLAFLPLLICSLLSSSLSSWPSYSSLPCFPSFYSHSPESLLLCSRGVAD
jgi:hypothetical protein